MDLMWGFGLMLTIYAIAVFLAGAAFMGFLWWIF